MSQKLFYIEQITNTRQKTNGHFVYRSDPCLQKVNMLHGWTLALCYVDRWSGAEWRGRARASRGLRASVPRGRIQIKTLTIGNSRAANERPAPLSPAYETGLFYC